MNGKDINHSVISTMMRIDLDELYLKEILTHSKLSGHTKLMIE